MTSVSSSGPCSNAAPPPLPATPELDPAALIDASRGDGRPRVRAWPVLAVGLGALMLWTQPAGTPAHRVGQVVAVLMLVAGYAAIVIAGRRIERRLAAESQAVAALEEFVQLRRWPEAADLAAQILNRPMLAPERRLAALMSLATVLARYHRFADARVVHEHLLAPDDGGSPVDATLAHAVRVARAMTLLRDDLLVDADRAMNELRRELAGARDAVRRARGPEAAAEVRSAGLVLLDLYRDVKTGHPDEAIAAFESAIAWLPGSLGLRVADAWVLAAAAYDRLGRADDAARAYANATTLVPAVELHRRYPETAGLKTNAERRSSSAELQTTSEG